MELGNWNWVIEKLSNRVIAWAGGTAIPQITQLQITQLPIGSQRVHGPAGEPLDALGNRRMGGEEAGKIDSQQRLDDEQVRR